MAMIDKKQGVVHPRIQNKMKPYTLNHHRYDHQVVYRFEGKGKLFFWGMKNGFKRALRM